VQHVAIDSWRASARNGGSGTPGASIDCDSNTAMGNTCCGGRRGAKDEIELTHPGYGKARKTLAQQQKGWAATGVVSLRDCDLRVRRPHTASSLQAIL
jgi:hypothetical protein